MWGYTTKATSWAGCSQDDVCVGKRGKGVCVHFVLDVNETNFWSKQEASKMVENKEGTLDGQTEDAFIISSF